jgi:hypothetical protein
LTPESLVAKPSKLAQTRPFDEDWERIRLSNKLLDNCPGAQLVFLNKRKETEARLGFAGTAVRDGWSRNVIALQIEPRLLDRQLTPLPDRNPCSLR